MRKKYLVLLLVLLVSLAIALTGCVKKKYYYIAPPPEPGVPSNLVATATSSTQIDLAWTDNSTDEKGFYVYRRNGGSYRRIVALEANTTSYSDTGLSPETTYWYKVTSYGDGGESGSSNEASATTMVEAEVVDYWMEKYIKYDYWYTTITGYIQNNTEEILNVWVAGEFYSADGKWIAIEKSLITNVNPARKARFGIYHHGKTEIYSVKAWVDEYY